MISNPYLFDQAKAVRCFGGHELMGDLLREFLPEVQARFDSLRQAVATGDRDQIEKALHWLAGGLSFLFSPAAEGVCLRLAELIQQHPLPCLNATLDELEMVIARLRAHLLENSPKVAA